MKIPYLKAVSIAVLALFILSLVPIAKTQGETQEYTVSFLVPTYPCSPTNYELNVSIPSTLFQYYSVQNHFVFSPADFSKFVTPYTLKPIADRLWQIYDNTEDYTNGVLALVHQIPYQEVTMGKYPVETLIDGNGDCDLFAYIAASILEAGGIPTVILYYKDQSHMEIAVDLGAEPTDARTQVYSVTYQNASYYVGECTGGRWRDGWRVGECPTDYQDVSVQIVGVENMAQSSIAQVSANLRDLDASTLNLKVSSSFMVENSPITISGQITPQSPNENVTLQVQSGSSWTTITTVETQPNGQFSYSWIPTVTGSIEVQASWLGNREFNGATSIKSSVVILPLFFVFSSLGAAAFSVAVTAGFLAMKHRKKRMLGLFPESDNFAI